MNKVNVFGFKWNVFLIDKSNQVLRETPSLDNAWFAATELQKHMDMSDAPSRVAALIDKLKLQKGAEYDYLLKSDLPQLLQGLCNYENSNPNCKWFRGTVIVQIVLAFPPKLTTISKNILKSLYDNVREHTNTALRAVPIALDKSKSLLNTPVSPSSVADTSTTTSNWLSSSLSVVFGRNFGPTYTDIAPPPRKRIRVTRRSVSTPPSITLPPNENIVVEGPPVEFGARSATKEADARQERIRKSGAFTSLRYTFDAVTINKYILGLSCTNDNCDGIWRPIKWIASGLSVIASGAYVIIVCFLFDPSLTYVFLFQVHSM